MGVRGTGGRPSVRKYTSYRHFLKAYYDYKKLTKPGFSYRKFAEVSGIKSPNFLQLVMQGKRNMSEDMGCQVSRAMGLVGAERSYFIALVKREAARKPEQVAEANKGLLRAVNRLVGKDMTSAQAQILASWHHAVVKELVSLPDFQAKGEWISKKLRGLITPRQAEESLELLQEAGFLARLETTEEGEREGATAHPLLPTDSQPESTAMPRYEVREPVVDTGDNFDFARVLKAHMQTLAVWQSILPTLSKEEREMGLLIFPISSERIPEFKERLRQFQDEIITWLADEPAPDRVMQLGTYLMPISN